VTERPGLMCAAFQTEFALELRLSYGGDLVRTELFRGAPVFIFID
jgi:hypothetical protein